MHAWLLQNGAGVTSERMKSEVFFHLNLRNTILIQFERRTSAIAFLQV